MTSATGNEADFRLRVASLSADQRRLLARKLSSAKRDFANGHRRQSPTGRLVAFIVTDDSESANQDELRSFSRTRLPEYMVPQVFRTLDALPRTSAGKIDRNAIQQFEIYDSTETTDTFVAPRNEAEAELADIWAEILGMDHVSIYDDFFEVGGDSLLSIRIIARAKRKGLNISAEEFFSNANIAAQAGIATQQNESRTTQRAPAASEHSLVNLEPSVRDAISRMLSEVDADDTPKGD